jgi:ADP-ribosylglycohydrolase
MQMTLNSLSRYRGCLVGLATGDAVGSSVEFMPRGSFPPVTGMAGGGPFGLLPGQWTDDTSMALCLAESLLECGFDPHDQMRRYLKWYRHGYLSSTGECFDIGNATSAALHRFEKENQPFCGSKGASSAGNGSLMRLPPVPMFFAGNPAQAVDQSGVSSLTTHAAVECVDACRYFGGLIAGALAGIAKDKLLSPRFHPHAGAWESKTLAPKVEAVANGSFKDKPASSIRGSGYVIDTLEAVLWAFHHSDSFEEGCLKVVNLGDDADTTGAVFGQLAGACYGVEAIPENWRKQIAMLDKIEQLATGLHTAARKATAQQE